MTPAFVVYEKDDQAHQRQERAANHQPPLQGDIGIQLSRVCPVLCKYQSLSKHWSVHRRETHARLANHIATKTEKVHWKDPSLIHCAAQRDQKLVYRSSVFRSSGFRSTRTKQTKRVAARTASPGDIRNKPATIERKTAFRLGFLQGGQNSARLPMLIVSAPPRPVTLLVPKRRENGQPAE